MISEKLRVFKLLLYKDFLVRKRHWKLGLFVEIAIPLLLFVTVWGLRNLTVQTSLNANFDSSITYPVEKRYEFLPSLRTKIYVVPDNPFITSYMHEVQNCLGDNQYMIRQFKTVEDMFLLMDYSHQQDIDEKVIAIIFKNNTIDSTTTHLDYKILLDENVPQEIYKGLMSRSPFKNGFVGLQLCLDESFIKIKAKNDSLKMHVNIQQMPYPPHVEPDKIDKIYRIVFCAFAILAFLIPLCIETSYASEEKFLGINVLMAMNGVPNYLNLLSWLLTGLIFSLTYIVPVTILVNLTSTDNAIPFLYYGNSFLFWLIFTMHFVHLVTFGMHVSAYFTRSSFVVTGLLILYIGSAVLAKKGFEEDASKIVPYFGIIFPNVLLFRACEEINYYESMMKGIQFDNLFRVGEPQYGTAGSIGMILIFSMLGSIFHFIMANYIYAINPGKYGVKKSPFYFLKFLRRSNTSFDNPEVEKFDCYNSNSNLFETVTGNVFTPGIQIRNLKKSYNTGLFSAEKVHALKGISVDFYQKQITALLGHNGAGKTTMMSILTGMISPSQGLVLIDGKNIKDDTDEIMKDIGLCPQENMFFPSLSVAEQLTFFALLKSDNQSRSMIKSQVTIFMQKLKLFEKRNALPKQLSGGQKRRVCLGMALVGDSSTIILDEPTSGLDPESRRDIWDILLKIRGEKTILISTHDMEEADILGDRVAIVHAGTLRSYGTSMFLKKILGQGNVEVTMSIESWCEPLKICNYLGSQSEIISTDGSKIQLSIPQTPALPDLLDKLENNKKELGITGMSVSLITLEQVFLRVTQDKKEDKSRKAFIDTTKKLTGRDLFIHIAMGLLRKKMTYTVKNVSTLFIMLILLFIPMLCIGFILMDHFPGDDAPEPIPIKLDMYHGGKTCYRTDEKNKVFGDTYEAVTKESYGKVIENLDKNISFPSALLKFGKDNQATYDFHLIAGAEFISENDVLNTTVLYNGIETIYSLPISVNLLTNTLLKTLVSPEYSISLEAQQFPQKQDTNIDVLMITTSEPIETYFVPIIFVCFFYPLVALFVIHPLKETLTNVKHLQRMTGASCFTYWGTMFLFDFVVMLIMIALVVIGFVVMDAVLGLEMLRSCETFILILLFVLFAVNILPLVYNFTFSDKGTSTAIKLLSLLPLGLIAVETIMTLVTLMFQGYSKTLNIIRPIQKTLFLLTPYVSFFHGLIAFFRGTRHYGNCIRISRMINQTKTEQFSDCKDLKCINGTCAEPPMMFTKFKEDIALETSILTLCLTPILYFGLLCILEHKLIHRLIVRIRRNKQDKSDEAFEEQVKKVKRDIAFEVSRIKSRESDPSFGKEVIEKTNVDYDDAKKHAFLAFELRKLYGNFVAVQDISFGVGQGECFGLLGVNGAGKSTTFKVVTGEEIPHKGEMYLNHMDIIKYGKHFLSQMGYCPQNDAIIKSLNAYDHLRLFARLRGIPASQVETEVQKWIDRLKLNFCASQPSGTYSGGNKRRLNIAMALIGKPNLVLLDEPTTGVDPAARRSLWNVIQSCQTTGQAVILTSHSMEECEALCNRLAIMVDGKFECIGPSQELKQRFGAGYNIQLKLDPAAPQSEIKNIKEDMNKAFDCEVMDENSGYLMYHLKSTDLTWRRMYDVVDDLKTKYSSIQDFSVLSSTLEQLFLVFARSANKSERKA